MNQANVGKRELRRRLGELLKRVKAGETIVVTERGVPFARIIPITPTVEERLHTLMFAGLVEWNGRKLPPYRPKTANRGDRLLADLVVKDR